MHYLNIPTELRKTCRHDSFTVPGCLTCEAADTIEALVNAVRAERDTAKLLRASVEMERMRKALELIAAAENSALDLAYCKGIARAALAKAQGGAA